MVTVLHPTDARTAQTSRGFAKPTVVEVSRA
jgi:hypothetical protein